MKGKRNLLIGIVLGGIIGWALGFLRLPLIGSKYSFGLGFVACLALVLVVLSILFVWNKNASLRRLLGKNPATSDAKAGLRTHTTVWIFVAIFILVGGLLSGFMIYRQNELFKTHAQEQNRKLYEQSILIESGRKSNQIFLVRSVLDKLDNELKQNPEGGISDAMVSNLAASSLSLKPYRYFVGDSLSQKKLSPERGQLLLALSLMDIDSISFSKIINTTSFAKADLHGADLKGLDLSGIDLKEADLQKVNLQEADLSGANLREANLWGANLDMAKLRGTNLKEADLRWARLNQADLSKADLNGVDLSNAILIRANLRETTIQWAKFEGTMLNEAILIDADLYGLNLTKANLSQANLEGARLKDVNLGRANLMEIELTKASVPENWFKKLDEWQASGIKEITETYKIVKDTSHRFKKENHFLKKRISKTK